MALPQAKISSTPKLSKAEYFAGVRYSPHKYQQPVHGSDARFRVVVAGRRWGKSKVASKEAGYMIVQPGTEGAVVAPTHPHTGIVFNEIVDDLLGTANLQRHVAARHKSPPLYLEFDWGRHPQHGQLPASKVRGFSADNADAARGYQFDWLVFDEAALSSLAVWEQVLDATLHDRDGWALFITTPQGYNYIYDFYLRGKDPREEEWFSIQSPTWDNPHHNPKRLAQAKKNLSPLVFDQEYGAKFTVMAGQVYPGFNYETHVIPEDKLDIPKAWPRYRGIDWGFSPDPFVMLWFAVDGEDRIYIYDEYVQRSRSLAKHCKHLVQKVQRKLQRRKEDRVVRSPLSSEWEVVSRNRYIPPFDARNTVYEWTVADPHGAGRSNMVTMTENGIPCWGMSTRIEAGLDEVRECLNTRDDGTAGLYVSSRCVNTIKEFNLYSYPDRDSKNVGDNPIDFNNHSMDVIRYFVMGLRAGAISSQRPRLG